VQLKSGTSKAIFSAKGADLFDHSCPKDNCFIKLSLISNSDRTTLATNYAYPKYLKNGLINKAPKPSLEVLESKDKNQQTIFTVNNKKGSVPALFVTLEA